MGIIQNLFFHLILKLGDTKALKIFLVIRIPGTDPLIFYIYLFFDEALFGVNYLLHFNSIILNIFFL